MLEIDLLFNDVPGNRVSSMLTQVVTQDDLSMFMGLLFTFNRVVAANFPSGRTRRIYRNALV
ncbi:hypothetical protein EON65_16485 [archaeon]|nr:MAG: hypothetical protein EON65_16485 [archaeon]